MSVFDTSSQRRNVARMPAGPIVPRWSILPIMIAALLSSLGAASAGPCTAQISQVEHEMQAAKGNPFAGPSAPQTIEAQLSRQPTAATVQRAAQKAVAMADAALQSARKADTDGDLAACEQALTRLKNLYGIG